MQASERGSARDDSPGMDVVKVFVEEPVGLDALAPDDASDARNRDQPMVSLESLLAPDARPYARAYVAGTHLGNARRVGATALDAPGAWATPLVAWAGDRPWHALGADGDVRTIEPREAARVLRAPDSVRALALGEPTGLADAVGGEPEVGASQRRERLPALRALLDRGAAVLFPEPAFDGHDWSLFARAPLRDPLVAAFREHPALGVRRLFAPYQRARGEHRFYLEQWAMDALPDWVEEV